MRKIIFAAVLGSAMTVGFACEERRTERMEPVEEQEGTGGAGFEEETFEETYQEPQLQPPPVDEQEGTGGTGMMEGEESGGMMQEDPAMGGSGTDTDVQQPDDFGTGVQQPDDFGTGGSGMDAGMGGYGTDLGTGTGGSGNQMNGPEQGSAIEE